MTHTAPNDNWKSNSWRVYALLVVIGIVLYCAILWNHKISDQAETALSIALVVVATLIWTVRENNNIRLMLFAITAFGGFRLIVWRILYTLNFTSALNALGSLALLFGELYAVFIFVLVTTQNFVLDRPKSTSEPIDPTQTDLPSADVLICTYNEPLEIVRRTLCGAMHIDYTNKRVYLCDDGRRAEMEDLARALGCNYITRTDNKFAKSGNINNALSQTNGELVLFLDADHIPCTSILQRCVSEFQDPQVGVVQFAHRFMNPAPIQRNLRLENILPGEQEMFFQVSMIGKNYWNGAIFAGSSGVIRRSILDKLGGMSQETVIEDCEFSAKMHAQGYKSIYIPESQSIALSPETLAAYFIQQNRWSRGQTQMLVLPSTSPFSCKGLTLAQRLCYLSGNIHYLFGLPRLIYIAIPAVFLLLGVSALKVSFAKYAIFAAPYLMIFTLSQNYIFKNFRHSFWSDVFETVLAPFVTNWTTATLIEPHAPKFHVTPKGIRWDHLSLDLRLVWPQILLLILCVFAFFVGALKLFLNSDPFGVAVNLVWDAYNSMTLTCAILCGLERPQLKNAFRVEKQLPVQISAAGAQTTLGGRTEDLNEFGARVRFPKNSITFSSGDEVWIEFETNESLRFQALVISTQTEEEEVTLALEFKDQQNDLKKLSELIALCYCSADTWTARPEPVDSLWGSFQNLFTTPFRVVAQAASAGEFHKLSIFVPKKALENSIISKCIPAKLKPHLVEVSDLELLEMAD